MSEPWRGATPASQLSVACIIPTHAREGLLQDALESVGRQSLAPDQVVVVDDVGRAETLELVHTMKGSLLPQIDYVALPISPKSGAARSRNHGATASRAAALAFLDDDDLWDPEFLREAMNHLAQAPEVDVVVAWTRMVRDGFSGPGLQMPRRISAAESFSQNPGLTGSNFVIRRAAFDEIGGFDEELPVANDKDFLIRLLDRQTRIAVIENELVQQRAHDQGQLTSRVEARALGLEKFMQKYRSRLTRRDRRELARVIHSVRRVSAETPWQRAYHFAAQVLTDSPRRAGRAALQRLGGRPTIYK